MLLCYTWYVQIKTNMLNLQDSTENKCGYYYKLLTRNSSEQCFFLDYFYKKYFSNFVAHTYLAIKSFYS